MMTVDDAIDRAMHQIDELLEKRYVALELQMFADGCTDFAAMEAVIQMQRERDAQWRAETVVDLRRQFEHNL